MDDIARQFKRLRKQHRRLYGNTWFQRTFGVVFTIDEYPWRPEYLHPEDYTYDINSLYPHTIRAINT